MRSPYDYSAVSTNNEENKPYHAREDSLPFSYGQISKTSTPIKNGSAGLGSTAYSASATYRNYYNNNNNNNNSDNSASASGTNYNFNSVDRGSYSYNKGNNYNNNNYGNGNLNNNNYKVATRTSTTTTTTSGNNVTDGASMIKPQPRLTSPLLVRKTLNSRSPTRSNTANTNTISNTYHYNSNGLNGNNNNYNDTITTLRKTPTRRDDFEELLRERREKVYNEYRSNNNINNTSYELQPYVVSSGSGREPPQPPQRQHNLSLSQYKQQTPSQHKYNYDFEFHLNLEDDDYLPPPRRANTMERPSLYQTRDILLPGTLGTTPRESSSYVERNYHTISSSHPTRQTSTMMYATNQQQQQKQQQTYEQRPPLASAPATTTQERITVNSNSTATYDRGFQPQQHQSRSSYNMARYGNENPPRYGSSGLDIVDYVKRGEEEYRSSQQTMLGETARNRTNELLSSPIYATTTKQVVNRSISSNNSNIASEPELTSITSASLVSRPETPAFPVTPRTPYGANNGYNTLTLQSRSPQQQRLGYSNGQLADSQIYSSETIYQTNNRPRLNSTMSMGNTELQEVAAHLVKFAKDSSKYWYKPNLSREDAISLLLNASPGTFIVRDSTTYKNAYGLVLRVERPPPGSKTDKQDELVRHFLIEPTTRGVRLKGCANEPVFTSLSALIYEHSINKLALPCLLHIPDQDLLPLPQLHTAAQKQLLTMGAACNVLWLYSADTESLTGEEAIRKAIKQLYAQQPLPKPTEVHFKVTQQGITLTDNTRKKFFRKHYSADIISYCEVDPDHRLWTMQEETGGDHLKKTIFAFVAKRSPSSKDNQCHVFCDLSISQPASAIVSFANKTLPTEKQRNYVL